MLNVIFLKITLKCSPINLKTLCRHQVYPLKVKSFDVKIFLNIRAFNYETRPVVTCKHLPWVGDGTNAEVKRNVNCDLYEKKGKTHIGDITEISASHRYCNHWLLFFYAVYVRKCIVGKGEDYRGKVSTTRSGLTCQQWWSKFPHDHRWVTSSLY